MPGSHILYLEKTLIFYTLAEKEKKKILFMTKTELFYLRFFPFFMPEDAENLQN